MFHYEPDTSAVPCLGCNELVADEDLVKLERHSGTSLFLWHPYHFWCVRDDPPPPRSRLCCVDCGERLSDEAIRSAVAWGATFERRLQIRMIVRGARQTLEHPEASTPRPPGVRLVAVARSPEKETGTDPLRDTELDTILGSAMTIAGAWTRRFEFVHDACPKVDSFIGGLRASSDRGDLLRVYADALEQRGDTVRAKFLELSGQRRSAQAELRQELTRQLRELRASLPSSWCRFILTA